MIGSRLTCLALVVILSQFTYSQTPAPPVAIVSAADYRSYVAPSSLATLYGSNLADSTASGQIDASGQLSTQLAGTSVQVCGEAAGLLTVSPTQINFVVPADLAPGLCPVVVTSSGRTTNGTADIRRVAPAFYTRGTAGAGRATALNAVTFGGEPFAVLTPENTSADKGTRVALFGTGFRNAFTYGNHGTDPTASVFGLFTDTSGESYPVTPEYVGPAAGFIGTDQVNVALPAAIEGSGFVSFVLVVDSVRSNSVTLNISSLSPPVITGFTPTTGTAGSLVRIQGANLGTSEMKDAGRVAVSLIEPNGLSISLTPQSVAPSSVQFVMPSLPASGASLYSGQLTLCVRVDSATTCSGPFTLTGTAVTGAPGQTFLAVTNASLQNGVNTLKQIGATPAAQALSANIGTILGQYADLVSSALSGNPKSVSVQRVDGTLISLTVDSAMINRLDRLAASLQPALTAAADPGTPSNTGEVLQPTCASSKERALQNAKNVFHLARTASKEIIQAAALEPIVTALATCVDTSTTTCVTNAYFSLPAAEATASLLTGLLYSPLLSTLALETQAVFLDSLQALPASSPQPAIQNSPSASALILPLGREALLTVQGHFVSAPGSPGVQQIVTPIVADAISGITMPTPGSIAVPQCDLCLKILATCPTCSASLDKFSRDLANDLVSIVSQQLNTVTPAISSAPTAADVELTAGSVSIDPPATSEVELSASCLSVPAFVNGVRSTAGAYQPFQFAVDPGVLLLSNEVSSRAPGRVFTTLNLAVGPSAPRAAGQTDKASYKNRELAYFQGSGFPAYTPVAIALSGPSLAEKVVVNAFSDASGTFAVDVPLYDAQQSGTYTLSAFIQNSSVRASSPISIAATRLAVQVSPPRGNWTSSPQVITVSAPGAQRIYYSVNQSIGSSAAMPPTPSAAANDGMITGSSGSLQLTGVDGQSVAWTYLFQAEDAGGPGSVSDAYTFAIDLRGFAAQPQISSIKMTPEVPLDGQPFAFLITGSDFDPAMAQVIFSGPSCPAGCTISNLALSKTATEVAGSMTLSGGYFSARIQNGPKTISNPVPLTVGFGTPSINGISTSPSLPINGQTFDFTVTGSSFDPSNAVVVFSGPGCTGSSNCTIANATMSSKSSRQLSGRANLADGIFSVTVQNAAPGAPSNAVPLSVSGARAGVIATSPNPPLSGQAFTFTITGTAFDPASVLVTFSGPGCTAPMNCSIPTSALLNVSPSQLSGTAILGGGSFTVTVRNGSSGTPSNGLKLTVSGSEAGTAQLSAIATTPTAPASGQPFIFTISGANFDPNTAIVIFAGPGCTTTALCTIPNGLLTNKTSTQLSGAMTLTGGSFTVAVQNGLTGKSNSLTLTVSGSTGVSTPVLGAITTWPSAPVGGQLFIFTITGSGFDPNSVTVVFDGQGCNVSTCTFSGRSLVSVTSTQLSGAAVLNTGDLTVTVQNGATGTLSNSLSLTVSGTTGGIQATGIAPSPNPPLSGQSFPFAITGSGFDPSTAMVVFSGPGCSGSACSIANSKLLARTSTQLTGNMTLAGGSFTAVVQNGPSGTPSNPLPLTVAGTSGVAPQLTGIISSPNPPLPGKPFAFTITGSGFDPKGASVFFGGSGCGPSTTCAIDNSGLSSASASQLNGTAVLASGTFAVTVLNTPGGTLSNALNFVVPAPVALQITGIATSPTQPASGQAFAFTITGTGFDSSSALVVFTGPGCTPCTITNSALSTRTSTQLSGTTALAAGNFTVTVQNGSGGAPSNEIPLTVSNSAGSPPQITSVTTAPALPSAGQAFTFTINGTGFDTNSVIVQFTGPGCGPCSISNSSLSSKTSTQLNGTATISSGGTFTVSAQNGSAGTPSNSITVAIAGSSSAPQLSSIAVVPNPPTATQAFTFTINGSGFDPNSAIVQFAGTGCSPCSAANADLSSKSATQLVGTATIPSSGSFSVTVKNGSSGTASNSLSLTVSGGGPVPGAPQLSSISTSPNPPVGGQSFSFTIVGSGFDGSSAIVTFAGPGCSTPCTIANSSLSSKSSIQLSGTTTLTAGSFTVTVQNGSAGTPSTSLSLTVSAPSAAGPQISAITTSPNPPSTGLSFTFTITGTGFDPNSALVTFAGPGCTPCTAANSQLTAKSAIQLSGSITLTAGTFTVTVKNGTSGTASNPQTLTVSGSAGGVAPQLGYIGTQPSPPNHGQQFQFIIGGTNFDPATVLITFTGPGCAPCTISNSALSSKFSTRLSGFTTLPSAGSYTLTAQNGASGSASNSLTLMVQ